MVKEQSLTYEKAIFDMQNEEASRRLEDQARKEEEDRVR